MPSLKLLSHFTFVLLLLGSKPIIAVQFKAQNRSNCASLGLLGSLHSQSAHTHQHRPIVAGPRSAFLQRTQDVGMQLENTSLAPTPCMAHLHTFCTTPARTVHQQHTSDKPPHGLPFPYSCSLTNAKPTRQVPSHPPDRLAVFHANSNGHTSHQVSTPDPAQSRR